MKKLIDVIKLAARANINVALWGRHGVGKTTMTNSLENHEICGRPVHVETVVLSHNDPLTFGGYPGRIQLGDGTHIMDFAKPFWFHRVQQAAAEGKFPIVFLDEFNRADKYPLDIALRLVSEKELNGHKLPKETIFVAALNPETASDRDVAFLNDPTIDRWTHVPVLSAPDMWIEWARGTNEIPTMLIDFIRQDKNRLGENNILNLFPEQVMKRVHPTERSVHAVGRILTALGMTDVIDHEKIPDYAWDMIAGLCGSVWTSSFVSYLRASHEYFTKEDMLSGSDEVIERVRKVIKTGNIQALVAALEKAHDEITEEDMPLDGFWRFLGECPEDIQVAFWYHDMSGSKYDFWSEFLRNRDSGLPEHLVDVITRAEKEESEEQEKQAVTEAFASEGSFIMVDKKLLEIN